MEAWLLLEKTNRHKANEAISIRDTTEVEAVKTITIQGNNPMTAGGNWNRISTIWTSAENISMG